MRRDSATFRAVPTGEFIFAASPHPFDADAGPDAGALDQQIIGAVDHLDRALGEVGAGLEDVVKLLVFYEDEAGISEPDLLARIGRRFAKAPGPVVTAVPLPALGRAMLQLDAIAMPDLPRIALPGLGTTPLARPFSPGLACGRMIFVSGQDSVADDGSLIAPGDIVRQSAIVMDRIGRVLEGCGAGFGDVIKINNYYVGGGTEADWEGAARVRARYFAEPGPAATGMPVPRHRRPGLLAKTEVIAMRGSAGEFLPRRHSWPEGHWDWPIHLPYKHGIACGDLIAVGGQVSLDPRGLVIAPGDIRRQTMTALDNIERVLAELDATLDHVVKVTAFYKAGGRELHHEICDLVARRFAAPGPARTFVPLPYLAYERMDVEIEAIAMIGHRLGG